MSNPNTPAVQAEKPQTPVEKLKKFLSADAMKAQILAALPKHIDLEKFLRILMTAVSQNPDLAGADQNSLLISCMKCAADGLMPDGKEAALVTFKNKNKGIIEVSYMPMYAGILKKMRNSGELKTIEAHIVHKADKFTYRPGIEEKPIFEPDWFAEDRGEVVGVFAVGETKDGAIYIEIMSKSQVGDVRGVSKAQFGPWDGPFADEMAKKSVIRRLSKRMPTSTDVEQVLKNDNHNYELDAPRTAPVSQQIAAPATSSAPQIEAPKKPRQSKAEKLMAANKTPAADPIVGSDPAEKTVVAPSAKKSPNERIPTEEEMDAAIERGGVDYGQQGESDFQGEFEDISPI